MCAPSRIRTCDHLLKRELLYQLSYRRISACIIHRHQKLLYINLLYFQSTMDHSRKTFIYISMVVILAAVAVLILIGPASVKPLAQQTSLPASPQTPSSPFVQGGGSFGAQVFDESQNPIANKVPTVIPQTNPIQDVYKNPFE